MLTVPEAARRVGRDPETVRRWIRSGRLRSQKVGTQHLIDEADLDVVVGTGAEFKRPKWLRKTHSGRAMPDSVGLIRELRDTR
ncbi:MAG TPA: helix-turn-helix domain-containing protein [Actinomycetota bacterium]|nr:helix-turn-helix domain-containing protein [Actinomycetota bacterium]